MNPCGTKHRETGREGLKQEAGRHRSDDEIARMGNEGREAIGISNKAKFREIEQRRYGRNQNSRFKLAD